MGLEMQLRTRIIFPEFVCQDAQHRLHAAAATMASNYLCTNIIPVTVIPTDILLSTSSINISLTS